MSTTPPPYDRQASFTNFHTEPAPTVGQDLEAEFNAVKQSQDATQARLSQIQRDDGKLSNLSVHPDALSSAVRAILSYDDGEIRGAWVTATVYNIRDVIEGPDGISYVAAVQHVANASFSVDLNAGRWLVIDSGLAIDEALRADLADSSNGAGMVAYIATGVGAIVRWVLEKLRERPSVLDYINPSLHAGLAAGTETATQHAAFNAAATAHKDLRVPPGTYYLTDMVTLPLGHRIRGAGKRKTIIKVPATFNLAAQGVFKYTAGEPAGEVSDLTIEFVQPDSAVVGDYTQYPPAVFAQGTPRGRLRRVRIALAWDGIDLRGNSGGFSIDDLELSMFNKGIQIDGSLDTVRINDLALWPYAAGGAVMTANQRSINKDAYGIYSARCDGLFLSNSLIFDVRKGVYCFRGAGAGDYTIGNFSNVAFDGDGGLHVIVDGRLQLSACYFTKDSADGNWLVQTGGTVTIAATRLVGSVIAPSGNGAIDISAGTLDISGCRMERGALDFTFVYASGTAVVNITGGKMISNAGVSFTKPAVRFVGTATGVVSGLYATPKGGGTGPLVTIDADNGVVVTGCNAEGWGITGPSTRTKTVVHNNLGPEHDEFTGYFSGDGVTTVLLPTGWTVSKPGTGNYTVNHPLALAAKTDLIVAPTSGVAATMVISDTAGSTVNAFKIRVYDAAGASIDSEVQFIAKRRRS